MNSIRILPSTTTGGSLQDADKFAGRLRFAVPYTTPESTRAALQMAMSLAGDLRAAVDLVAVQVIPLISPLMPDARTSYLSEQLRRIATDSDMPVWPAVVLTRDLDLAFRRLLPPGSIVIIAVPANRFRDGSAENHTWRGV